MTLTRASEIRRAIGVAMLIFAVCAIATSALLIWRASTPSVLIDAFDRATDTECRQNLHAAMNIPRSNAQGDVPRISDANGIIFISIPNIQDPKAALADATAALAACPNRVMRSFCLGEACGNNLPGTIRMTMQLTRLNPRVINP
jgi:hypothetical protein